MVYYDRKRLLKRTCPICKGRGKINEPYSRKARPSLQEMQKPKSPKQLQIERNTIMAKLLRKEGYSYEEIRLFLGFGSKRSVQLCLQREIADVQDRLRTALTGGVDE